MIHEISDGYVKVETHTGVTTIEFFHPQSNSLPEKILSDLEQEIHSAGNDDRSKVLPKFLYLLLSHNRPNCFKSKLKHTIFKKHNNIDGFFIFFNWLSCYEN